MGFRSPPPPPAELPQHILLAYSLGSSRIGFLNQNKSFAYLIDYTGLASSVKQ